MIWHICAKIVLARIFGLSLAVTGNMYRVRLVMNMSNIDCKHRERERERGSVVFTFRVAYLLFF